MSGAMLIILTQSIMSHQSLQFDITLLINLNTHDHIMATHRPLPTIPYCAAIVDCASYWVLVLGHWLRGIVLVLGALHCTGVLHCIGVVLGPCVLVFGWCIPWASTWKISTRIEWSYPWRPRTIAGGGGGRRLPMSHDHQYETLCKNQIVRSTIPQYNYRRQWGRRSSM